MIRDLNGINIELDIDSRNSRFSSIYNVYSLNKSFLHVLFDKYQKAYQKSDRLATALFLRFL